MPIRNHLFLGVFEYLWVRDHPGLHSNALSPKLNKTNLYLSFQNYPQMSTWLPRSQSLRTLLFTLIMDISGETLDSFWMEMILKMSSQRETHPVYVCERVRAQCDLMTAVGLGFSWGAARAV